MVRATRSSTRLSSFALCEVAIGGSVCPLRPGAIDFTTIESAAFLRIRQHFMGSRYRLETLLGASISGIEIRMVALGELAISAPDILERGIARHPENLLGVVVDV